MAVTTRGERELALRFESFPAALHARLESRIRNLVEELQARAQSAAPRKTGRLKSEITARVFADNPQRVAGYVEVYAPGIPGEYAKAATLEYGTDKPRRRAERQSLYGRISGKQRRFTERVGKAVHIRAYRYLGGSFDELRPQMVAELEAALAEATTEGPST